MFVCASVGYISNLFVGSDGKSIFDPNLISAFLRLDWLIYQRKRAQKLFYQEINVYGPFSVNACVLKLITTNFFLFSGKSEEKTIARKMAIFSPRYLLYTFNWKDKDSIYLTWRAQSVIISSDSKKLFFDPRQNSKIIDGHFTFG